MIDLGPTIIAKSDQLNADDLISGPMTITITQAKEGSQDQPVHFSYKGSGRKSFRPCKSMRRVIAEVWGRNATEAVGKSMTVFRDQTVQYGGQAVGGVRISHMSHISEPRSVSLITTKGRRGLYVVNPLIVDVQTPQDRSEYSKNPEHSEDKAAVWVDQQIKLISESGSVSDLESGTSAASFIKNLQRLEGGRPELAKKLKAAISARIEVIQSQEPDVTDPALEEEWA